jgi:hypothetical protein
METKLKAGVYSFSVPYSLTIAQRFNAGKIVLLGNASPVGTKGTPLNKHGSVVPAGTSHFVAVETQR